MNLTLTARNSTRAALPMLTIVTLLAVGCTTTRTVTVMTKPPDARIKIDGVDYGVGPVTRTLAYRSPGDTHWIEANRTGYKMTAKQLTRDDKHGIIEIELPVQTRDIHLAVKPLPGIIRVNGEQVSDDAKSIHTLDDLPFTVDANNNWTSYTITAERPGFRTAQVNVTWTDKTPSYTLQLEPLRKDLNISSSPSGASVFLDGQELGTTPLLAPGQPFPVNIDTEQFEPRTLRLEKPGYDPVEMQISWEDGRTDYDVDLKVKQKPVRITTDPPEAEVMIEGAKPVSDGGAMRVYALEFPPQDPQSGELRTYKGVARMEPQENREWEPKEFTIAWDEGRTDYHFELKEILTQEVAMLTPSTRRGESGWEIVPERVTTIAMKDKTEPSRFAQPVLIARPNPGRTIGSMAVSPDGRKVLFTELSAAEDGGDFRSQMFVVRTDNSNSIDIVTDGRTLDIMPSFTPGGEQILFSSNRAGRRMQIWSISSTGEFGVTRMTTSETHDLWPSLDSDPKPRLFYQAMVDTRPDPRIFVTPINTLMQTDLSQLGGTQPRVSPRNDEVLFCAANEQTGKRDIYKMSVRGGRPQNLTNTPDSDECDPVWSRDGRRIAFSSDRGTDAEGRHNYDIWVIDLAKPDAPKQVTANGSLDDHPEFDPRGNNALYFRSNRGGQWAVWRTGLR